MSELVSIIVPVYNTAKFVEETVQSVQSQSYSNWELIMVDDGSTDDSAEVIHRLAEKDSRISYFFKENGGQASARNFGIKQAKGDLIAFLDADDIWLPNKLENQMVELEKYGPDFLYGMGYFYHPNKEKKLEPYHWITGSRSGEDFFLKLYHSCAVNTNTVLLRKEIFEKVGLFDESHELRGTEDWDLWMRVARNIKSVYGSKERNVYYRIHEGGIHLQHARMLIGRWKIFEKYDTDPQIPALLRKREYRYTFRELMNHLMKEGRENEIKDVFSAFVKKDPYGIGTLNQRLWITILPVKSFIWLSNNLIYRIAYRLEKVTYWIKGI